MRPYIVKRYRLLEIAVTREHTRRYDLIDTRVITESDTEL